MATKQEHLCELVSKYMKTLGGLSTTVYSMLESNAEALAERDAAREELRSSWCEGVDDAIAVLHGNASGVASKDHEEWSAERTKFLLVGRENIVANRSLMFALDAAREEAADWKSKFEHADATAEQVLGLWNGTLGMREELATLKAAHPESAPVVGGVTELMLDEIQHLVDQYPYCPGVDEKVSAWLTSARAAIRAQKRVDVEAIRSLAHALPADYRYGKKVLLQAIGDEPAEAPVAEERCKTLDEWRRKHAEPAAPAQEQEGPFTDNGGFGWINDNGVAQLKAINEEAAKRYTRLLNAGLEAPKLRARVAELEDADSRLRNDVTAWTHASNRHRARADAAEAKLAALGENPIRRELVERWLQEVQPRHVAALVLEQILAGREPGVAS